MKERMTDEQLQEIEARCVTTDPYMALVPGDFTRAEVKLLLAEIKALKQERDAARQAASRSKR